MEEFDRTQQLNVDDMVKTIPVICSWCNKIYHIKQWQVEKGKVAVASHGMCPDCEKKQQEELESALSEPDSDAGAGDDDSDDDAPFRTTRTLNMDDMPKLIPQVCAWCNKIYHIKEWKVEKGRRTGASHGLCPDCEKKQRSELEKLKKQ